MIQPMKTFLFLAEKAELENRIGGAFGAHGWSTEAQERIYQTMKTVFKMDMVSGPLLLKSASLGGGIQMAQDYGRDIAKKMT
jgi:flavorubredoxin